MTELSTPENTYSVFSEIIFEGDNKIKAVELLVNKRKIQIQNLDPFKPLAAYITEDQVLEYVNEHWENPDLTSKSINEHVTVFDYSNTQIKNSKIVKRKDPSQEKFKVVYKEVEKELRNPPSKVRNNVVKRKIVNAQQDNLVKRF